MRIAIDYTAAIRQEAGIGSYVRNLVKALLSQDTSNEYTLLASGRPTRQRPFPKAPNARGHSIPIPDRYLNVLWYRWRVPLSATLFSGAITIYHGPDFVLPPLSKKVRTVVTIHDLAFLEHPEYAVPTLATHLQQAVPHALAAADVVTTVSAEVQRSILAHFPVSPSKLTVIPNGVSANFRRITDPVLLGATRHKFGLKHPLVLGVGTLEPRKNHIGLIKAFHQAQQQKHGPAMLAIAGGHGWLYEETQRVVATLKLEKKVRFLGHVSEFELISLYSMADVFAFPSFSEGFGIPPLEAMACGAPVITSNCSSLPEVVGNAALLVDPQNSSELANAILRVLEDVPLRERLQQQGYQRAQQFSWSAAARKMLLTYQKLSSGADNFSDEETIE